MSVKNAPPTANEIPESAEPMYRVCPESPLAYEYASSPFIRLLGLLLVKLFLINICTRGKKNLDISMCLH